MQELKKQEMYQMLAMDTIESVQTGWASPIIIVLRKMELFAVVQTTPT